MQRYSLMISILFYKCDRKWGSKMNIFLKPAKKCRYAITVNRQCCLLIAHICWWAYINYTNAYGHELALVSKKKQASLWLAIIDVNWMCKWLWRSRTIIVKIKITCSSLANDAVEIILNFFIAYLWTHKFKL